MADEEIIYRVYPRITKMLVGLDGTVWQRMNVFGQGKNYRMVPIPMELRRESEIYIPHAIGLHRILLESFVGPPFDGAVARHLDADPGNNSISNLAWGTVQENAIDRLRHDGAKPNASTENRVKNNKLFEADIPVIYRRYLAGTSRKELAAEYNVTVTAIKLIIDGKTWKHVAREPNRDDSSWR